MQTHEADARADEESAARHRTIGLPLLAGVGAVSEVSDAHSTERAGITPGNKLSATERNSERLKRL